MTTGNISTQPHRTVGGTAASVPLASYRVALVAVLLAVGLATHALVSPWSRAGQLETELLQLLRGMVVIKAVLGIAVAAFVLWRLRPPLGRPAALGYALATGLLTLSLVWLWSLVLVPAASLLFYVSVAALLVIAHRDRSLVGFLEDRLRARAAARRR